MSKYKIVSKEEGYTGNGASVSFLNGEASTESKLVADWHERKGYKVEEIPEDYSENLEELTVEQLKLLAQEKGIEIKTNLKKADILELIGESNG